MRNIRERRKRRDKEDLCLIGDASTDNTLKFLEK